MEELETKPFAYDGPHEVGKTYAKGNFVTHDGSLWHCNYKTASRPGDGPAWTLAVKRGRDAR
ncbi:carbohydrate-binding family V/XII protein [Rhizobacter sp. Root404]|nr:carbohydrate-binding family V/XII protein [Rhizobacter sp. Root404]